MTELTAHYSQSAQADFVLQGRDFSRWQGRCNSHFRLHRTAALAHQTGFPRPHAPAEYRSSLEGVHHSFTPPAGRCSCAALRSVLYRLTKMVRGPRLLTSGNRSMAELTAHNSQSAQADFVLQGRDFSRWQGRCDSHFRLHRTAARGGWSEEICMASDHSRTKRGSHAPTHRQSTDQV